MTLLGQGSVPLTQGGEDEAHAGEPAQDVAAGWQAAQRAGDGGEALGFHGDSPGA